MLAGGVGGDWDETINHVISECCKIGAKRVQDKIRLVGEGDPLRIVPKIKIWLFY